MPSTATPEQRPRAPAPAEATHMENALKPAKRRAGGFPIVGLGASAGGLEALRRFFERVAGHKDAAYVVVQHQDPAQPGRLPELLQRYTDLPVLLAENHTVLQPGHVYVAPPDRELSILHCTLFLLDPSGKRTPYLPVDGFFRALAADCRGRAVGVVLSGMGSDGTLGLRAIKESAGLTLAQEPTSAAFAAMPQSAIEAGLADVVILPEEMPARIEAYFHGHGRPGAKAAASPPERKPQSALETIVILLREHTGNDFSLYKKSSLSRRIERRMALHQLASTADYAHYLRDNEEELDALFDELLIGVTSFFRDPPAWNALIEHALPGLLDTKPESRTLRAWVAACSTGEEAYSLAIAFHEAQARFRPASHHALQIFATDLDENAVAQARAGLYPGNIAADVAPERLAAWFDAEDGGYRVKPEIRNMLVFARQNVLADPPFSHLDIICCRNLLIYLSFEQQERLMQLFHLILNHHGILMLGSAEDISRFSGLFVPIDLQQRIYQSVDHLDVQRTGDTPGEAAASVAKPEPAPASAPETDLAQSSRQVERLREAVQATREELQATSEELLSTKDELLSTKQELQALNEELQTINTELQADLAEMSSQTCDMENLLANTDLAAVILDARLNIRRFTPAAKGLFKLLQIDVGRPLSDITSDLDYAGLPDDARLVSRSLITIEKTVRSQDGRHFRVRITPYHDSAQRVAGVVINFTDISTVEAWRAAVATLVRSLGQELGQQSEGKEPGASLQRLLQEAEGLLHPGTPDRPGGKRRTKQTLGRT